VRRRLLVSTALIALVAVVVLGVPLAIVEAHRVRQDADRQLVREADDVAIAIDDRLERRAALDPRVLARLVRPHHEVTVAVPGRRLLRVGTPIEGRALAEASPLAQSAVVTARASREEVVDRVWKRWLLILALSGGGVFAAVLLGLAQARRLARPLERLARTAQRLGDGDFSARAGHFAIPEVDAAASALDASARSIAGLLAGEREFSVNASHQLRTPLTALRLRLEELQQLDQRPVVRDEVDRALAEADRLDATISNLLAATRGPGARRGGPVIDVSALLRAHAETWRPLFSRAGRALRLDAAPATPTTATPGAVGQAVDVLLDNALRHGDGEVHVGLASRPSGPVIIVDDEGHGPPPGDEAAIFERGHSGAGGTGVGLHLARSLVQAVGGDVVLETAVPPRFAILLPTGAPGHDAEATDVDPPRSLLAADPDRGRPEATPTTRRHDP
jgi:signal transduction histidine kinase